MHVQDNESRKHLYNPNDRNLRVHKSWHVRFVEQLAQSLHVLAQAANWSRILLLYMVIPERDSFCSDSEGYQVT